MTHSARTWPFPDARLACRLRRLVTASVVLVSIAFPSVRVHAAPRQYSANTNLVWIPAGSFRMGDDNASDPAEQPAAAIHVDAFAIDACEVAYTNWFAVRRWALTNGYFFATGHPALP